MGCWLGCELECEMWYGMDCGMECGMKCRIQRGMWCGMDVVMWNGMRNEITSLDPAWIIMTFSKKIQLENFSSKRAWFISKFHRITRSHHNRESYCNCSSMNLQHAVTKMLRFDEKNWCWKILKFYFGLMQFGDLQTRKTYNPCEKQAKSLVFKRNSCFSLSELRL